MKTDDLYKPFYCLRIPNSDPKECISLSEVVEVRLDIYLLVKEICYHPTLK